MTLLTLCLCVFLFVSPMHATWDDLIVHWSDGGEADSKLGTAFYSIPTTASDASSQGWTQVDSDSEYWNIWCYASDPRVCVLTDQQGNLAGMDIGVPPSDIASNVYDTTEHAKFENITRLGMTITRTRFFLVSQDVLESGGRSDMTEGIGTGLWLKNGESLEEIPLTAEEIEINTNFTSQSCIPTMGKHYFYNMTEDMECPKFEPNFILTDPSTGKVHGMGTQFIGLENPISRTWFEATPPYALKVTVPQSPACLLDWVTKFGVMTLHIYFRSSPWTIAC